MINNLSSLPIPVIEFLLQKTMWLSSSTTEILSTMLLFIEFSRSKVGRSKLGLPFFFANLRAYLLTSFFILKSVEEELKASMALDKASLRSKKSSISTVNLYCSRKVDVQSVSLVLMLFAFDFPKRRSLGRKTKSISLCLILLNYINKSTFEECEFSATNIFRPKVFIYKLNKLLYLIFLCNNKWRDDHSRIYP